MKNEIKVYTYGVFDLLHIGHIKSLKLAKRYGRLTVGVFSDRVAESFKRKPIIPEDQRMAMVKELKCVDEVVLLDKLVPDVKEYNVIAKGDWDSGEYRIKKDESLKKSKVVVEELYYNPYAI